MTHLWGGFAAKTFIHFPLKKESKEFWSIQPRSIPTLETKVLCCTSKGYCDKHFISSVWKEEKMGEFKYLVQGTIPI